MLSICGICRVKIEICGFAILPRGGIHAVFAPVCGSAGRGALRTCVREPLRSRGGGCVMLCGRGITRSAPFSQSLTVYSFA